MTTLPGEALLAEVLEREARLLDAGGAVLTPSSGEAAPAALCGPKRFYAVTGFPIKEKGSAPGNLACLDSPKISALGNLSADIHLAARNALAAILPLDVVVE